ncbi:MAG TPA: DNA polymerase III subunit delta [Acholeplasma sp.]|nr:DNA polymerase III subunit delta [Acholeplasma sp.]
MKEQISIIYGKNDFLVENKLKELINQTEVDEINTNRYDLLETSSEDVIEDLRTISFFSDKKIIIIDNFDDLLSKNQSIIADWIDYLKKPNPDVFLFIILKDLISEDILIGKTLLQYGYLVEVKDMTNEMFPSYITNYLKEKKFDIEKKACEELLVRTEYNLNLIMQELEKLMLYKYDDKKIDLNAVQTLVSKNLEENIYELTNSILSNNNNKTIEIYYDLLAKSEDPLRIMNNVATKIRQLIHTKILLEKRYNQDEIKDHFNIKSGAAYYLIKDANAVSFELLESILDKLSKLDFDIKTGKIDKKIGLELFILGV